MQSKIRLNEWSRFGSAAPIQSYVTKGERLQDETVVTESHTLCYPTRSRGLVFVTHRSARELYTQRFLIKTIRNVASFCILDATRQ